MPEGYRMRAIPRQMVEGMDDPATHQWFETVAERKAAGVFDPEFQRLIDG
jgi:hypothetical protein